jgi:hemoglobin-like flavoprotein
MTSKESTLLQDTFNLILPNIARAAELFYNRLFFLAPELQSRIRASVESQERRMMQVMTMIVGAGRTRTLPGSGASPAGEPKAAGDGRARRVPGTMEDVLLWTLEHCLGKRFTPEAREAWRNAYSSLA